jgi:hypothetical protein
MRLYQAISGHYESEGLTAHHKFFATLGEAKTSAKIASDTTELDVEVFKLEIGDDKASIIAFMNDGTAVRVQERVYTAKYKSGN